MQYIEICGNSYPISFGYGALIEYETLTGKSSLSLIKRAENESIGLTELITLLACGLQNGSDEAGTPQAFPVKSVARMLDKEPDVEGIFKQTMKLLENSFAKDESAAKKKTVTMQPNRAARRKAS